MNRTVMLVLTLLLLAAAVQAQELRQHIVQRGDSFASIARKYGITEQELMDANPTSTACYAGRKLTIPRHGVPVQRKAPEVQEPDLHLRSSDQRVVTKSPVTAYQTGQALWKQGRYELAMEYLKVAANGGESRAYYPLGAYYALDVAECHNNDSALFWLEKVTDKEYRAEANKIVKAIKAERKARAAAEEQAHAEVDSVLVESEPMNRTGAAQPLRTDVALPTRGELVGQARDLVTQKVTQVATEAATEAANRLTNAVANEATRQVDRLTNEATKQVDRLTRKVVGKNTVRQLNNIGKALGYFGQAVDTYNTIRNATTTDTTGQ